MLIAESVPPKQEEPRVKKRIRDLALGDRIANARGQSISLSPRLTCPECDRPHICWLHHFAYLTWYQHTVAGASGGDDALIDVIEES